MLSRTLLTVVATAAALTSAGAAHAAPNPSGPTKDYVVQLAGEPVATTTALRTARAHAHADKLAVQRQRALSKVPGARKLYDYQYTFNGFAARLTDAQVRELQKTPGVLAVVPDEILRIDTVQTPAFLGLDGPGGAWQRQFGGPTRAGEGVIIGDIDTGFWPEAPSFGSLPEPRPDQAAIDAKWHGTCDPGLTGQITCNNKVIGARWYRQASLPGTVPGEFNSPRDFNGHGSHTASTAAGNHGLPVVISGTNFGNASGMAPAARLAIYKVCWSQGDGGGLCGTIDSVAAIDQAVADGVDVLNFSIGGSTTSVVDPVQTSFRNAAAAGIFVATSAGNTPGASTVGKNAPWMTTVAASTHDRGFTKTVTLGDGRTFAGIGMGGAVGPAPFVHASLVGLAGANPTAVSLCTPGTLDPALTAGKIVACDRGVVARVDKSLAVKQAGGIGMVHINLTPNSLDADLHHVPTVHLDNVTGAPVRAYSLTAGATASLSATDSTTVRAPQMAAFSSQGPAFAGGGDLLKPDITAPGVSVMAAAAPPGPVGIGQVWGQISGTSMATPHVAGAAALLHAKHPNWSPMAIKSALMTTANPLDNQGLPIQRNGVPANPFDFGAGHLTPAPAFDPGLVYDSDETDWFRYMCGIGQHPRADDGTDLCPSVGTIDPSNLNYPSIAIGDIGGSQTVVRRVTNVSGSLGIYQSTVEAPPGYTVRVLPSVLAIPSGASRAFLVTFTRTDAALGQWSFGSLTWSDGRGHAVRSPIALRGFSLFAPEDLVGTGRLGATATTVNPAYTGTLTAGLSGLVPAVVTDLPLTNPNAGPAFSLANPQVGPHTARHVVTLTAPATLARFGTLEFDYAKGTDLNVYVYLRTAAGLALIGGANKQGTSEDNGTFFGLPAGTYEVFVDLTNLPAGQTATTARLHTWLTGGAAGNAIVAPSSQPARSGRDAPVILAWHSLASGQRYLGLVTFTNGTDPVGFTVLRVDT